MCRPKYCGADWRYKRMTKGNETNYFYLITYGGGWLKFPCRYSLSGCLKITPDALQIRPGSELPSGAMLNGSLSFWAGNCCEIYWLGSVNVSQSVTPFFFWLSTNANVPFSLLVYIGIFCLRLSGCERPNDWNSPLYLMAGGRRELTEKGTEICLSIFFFLETKMWELLFYPEWVSGVLWRRNYAPAFACLGFLSIFRLPR